MVFIFATFIVSIIFTSVRITLAPTVARSAGGAVRVKGDYALMLVQCILGALAMLLPGYLRRSAGISIPDSFMIGYAFFLYCGIYLGEVGRFYYILPFWDSILHTFSGAALGLLGFSVVSLLNGSETVAISLSPFFVAVFAFSFAMALDVLWEIYEFALDAVLKTNMQKYALETGEALVGHAAVVDTMEDLIVDCFGALLASVAGGISLRRNKGWLKGFELIRREAEQPSVINTEKTGVL
jgi:hypothetical protein